MCACCRRAPRSSSCILCHVRRGPPDVQDQMLNSHSKLNCITACIQAAKAGADEAPMLDPHGFVATCNSTNFFVVRDGEVWAPTTKYQLHGITRQHVLDLCRENGSELSPACLLAAAGREPLAAAAATGAHAAS